MPQTRAHQAAVASGKNRDDVGVKADPNNHKSKNKASKKVGPKKDTPAKRKSPAIDPKTDNDEPPEHKEQLKQETPSSPPAKKSRISKSPPSKATKDNDENTQGLSPDAPHALIELLSKYGTDPLYDLGLKDSLSPTAATIFAHLLYAILSSTRISHALAAKTFTILLEHNYHDLITLKKSTWQERTEVLTDGGYTRYREKTATQLGEVVEMIEEKYKGDLNELRKQAGNDPIEIRRKVREIKGLGEVGVEIFCGNVQGAWECLAPVVQKRDVAEARRLALVGEDVKDDKVAQKIWEMVGRDAKRMARLSAALTRVRLEHKEDDILD